MNEILSTLTGKKVEDPRIAIMRGFQGVSTYTANCEIKTNSVFSISSGNVLSIERSPRTNNWCITVEVGPSRWIRYAELSSTAVLVGKTIYKRDFIGYGDNGHILLEYCTSNKTNYPVRLLGIQLYKQDPTPILFTKKDIEDM